MMAHILDKKHKTLRIEKSNRWITLWLNRPMSKNALSFDMIYELNEVCQYISENYYFRGLALRGVGECFCAGADLKELKTKFLVEDIDRRSIIRISKQMAKLLETIHKMPQLTVALVDGPAFAGGFGLISCVDFVLATESSRFSISETKIGLTPAQIAPYVIEKVGSKIARKLMLSGMSFDANKAQQFGIIDELVESDHALTLAFLQLQDKLKYNSPYATAKTKEILRSISHIEPSKRAKYLAQKFADCIMADEGQEGLTAFEQKRNPKWVNW